MKNKCNCLCHILPSNNKTDEKCDLCGCFRCSGCSKVYQENELDSHYNSCIHFKRLLDNVIKELSKPDLFMVRVKEDEK